EHPPQRRARRPGARRHGARRRVVGGRRAPYECDAHRRAGAGRPVERGEAVRDRPRRRGVAEGDVARRPAPDDAVAAGRERAAVVGRCRR
ncbi:MAG: hypothetical protein AVDCRST_MAG06-2514, partial [uncultured Nocardioides sp.]